MPPKRKVRILLDEVAHAEPLLGQRRLDLELAERAQEPCLGSCAKATSREIRNLGNNESGDDELQIAARQDGSTTRVIAVGSVSPS